MLYGNLINKTIGYTKNIKLLSTIQCLVLSCLNCGCSLYLKPTLSCMSIQFFIGWPLSLSISSSNSKFFQSQKYVWCIIIIILNYYFCKQLLLFFQFTKTYANLIYFILKLNIILALILLISFVRQFFIFIYLVLFQRTLFTFRSNLDNQMLLKTCLIITNEQVVVGYCRRKPVFLNYTTITV